MQKNADNFSVGPFYDITYSRILQYVSFPCWSFDRKSIIDERGKLKYLDENEPLEVLHYKFDTKKNEFFNFGKKSLIQGLVFAYKNHYPMTITPDMIWLLILQGYSRFMDK